MLGKKIYLTEEGYEKLKKELDELINKKRPQIISKVKEAREYGDLSENSEYDQARAEQSFVESRIEELQRIFKNVQIIKKNFQKDIVSLGSTVVVAMDGKEEVYTIVGSTEADPAVGKISNESEVGKALLGKKINDRVKIEVPSGTIEYVIKKIE